MNVGQEYMVRITILKGKPNLEINYLVYLILNLLKDNQPGTP